MEDLQKELEEQREMAGNRLSELDRLHQNHREVLQQLEYLKMDVRHSQSKFHLFIIYLHRFFLFCFLWRRRDSFRNICNS